MIAASVSKARSDLRDLLSACRAVEAGRKTPFAFDVGDASTCVATHFPVLQDPEDLRLDAEVLDGLARVLQIQEARLRYEASLFLADPQLLADKLASLSLEVLANAFLASWHPIAGLEQATGRGLSTAKRYFDALLPWAERRIPEPKGRAAPPRPMGEEELAAIGVLRKEGFLGFLGALWEELKATGTAEYRGFVARNDAVRRAYGVAFLVSYGYAELTERDGRLELRANPERVERKGNRSVVVVLGGPT